MWPLRDLIPEESTSSLMDIPCEFCGLPVNPKSRLTLQKVAGWEKKRSQGGANQIILREPLPNYAHASCIDERKQGIHPEQALLFEQEETHAHE